jgi:hypothetical protein
MVSIGILMNINNLRLINKDKLIPFYYLNIGKDFRVNADIAHIHLCPYTKIDKYIIRCDHGSVPISSDKILVKPL